MPVDRVLISKEEFAECTDSLEVLLGYVSTAAFKQLAVNVKKPKFRNGIAFRTFIKNLEIQWQKQR